MIYKKKDQFDEWEFTYDPLGDRTVMQAGVTPQPAGSSVTGVGSLPNGTGPPIGQGQNPSSTDAPVQ
jgi:hypothetical protein